MFWGWASNNIAPLSPNPPVAPQDHSRLIEVLGDVVMKLQNSEALRPVVADQHKVNQETKGWYHIPPTAQCTILDSSTTDRYILNLSPPPSIHHFINKLNTIELQ